MALKEGLIHYFNFDVSGSTTVYDVVSGDDATITDANGGFASGKIGNAYYLPTIGTSNSRGVEMPTGVTDVNFEYDEPFSFNCWYKSDWLYDFDYLFYKIEEFDIPSEPIGGATIKGYEFSSNHSNGVWTDILFKLTCNYDDGGYLNTDRLQSSIRINPMPTYGDWHMYTATYDGSGNNTGLKTYLNGVLLTGATQSGDGFINGTTITNNKPLLMSGADSYFDDSNRGYQDESGVWDKELSASEVSQLYNSGAGLSFDDFTTTITTSEITDIAFATATGGGEARGVDILQKGICWNTTGSPTTGDTITNEGSGSGEYVSYLIGLDSSQDYYVRAYANDTTGTTYGNEVTFTTTSFKSEPFCTGTNYTLSGTTCGGSDGSVNITDEDYIISYDFTLTDTEGSVSQLTGLTAGYYFLNATPKPEYNDYFGGVSCDFDWLRIEATDTTMILDSTSIKKSSCMTFGGGTGRIVYFCSDSGSTGNYTTKLYTSKGTLVSTVTGTTITQVVFAGLSSGIYYATVTNENNSCVLLIGSTEVKNIDVNGVAGISRLFVTEWNNLVEYNYWSAADEDFYVSGLDNDFFSSIKIKEFIDSTLPSAWFEIIMDTKGVTYQQVMNKTHQGFVFTDTMELVIPHTDNDKWRILVDFLTEKYIIVFKDNNQQWWVMGYRLGSKVDGYRRANNQYVLTFNAISDNKIITNIDEDYVNNNIINS